MFLFFQSQSYFPMLSVSMTTIFFTLVQYWANLPEQEALKQAAMLAFWAIKLLVFRLFFLCLSFKDPDWEEPFC